VPEPVSLRERIQEDTTAAMRSGDVLRRDVLRMASNAAYNLEKQQQRDLTEDERWALAFHVAGLAAPEAARARGRALWTAGKGRDVFPDLASLATRSPRELQSRHGGDAAALLAYLRADPEALVPHGNAAIAISLRLLRQSLGRRRALPAWRAS